MTLVIYYKLTNASQPDNAHCAAGQTIATQPERLPRAPATTERQKGQCNVYAAINTIKKKKSYVSCPENILFDLVHSLW